MCVCVCVCVCVLGGCMEKDIGRSKKREGKKDIGGHGRNLDKPWMPGQPFSTGFLALNQRTQEII